MNPTVVEHIEVLVNGHHVMLRAGGLAGLELKQEAVAQGAELQLGFDMWGYWGNRWVAVYDANVIDMRHGQEFLAVTTDDHGPPLPGPAAEHPDPPASGWRLVLPPPLWADLSGHLLADGGEHAAVLLADWSRDPRGLRLQGRTLIAADDDADYLQGSTGYRSLTSEFIRDAALRSRDQRCAYLAVHNHQDAGPASFSHVELAGHERGYPALRRITGQPVGAFVLTTRTAAGDLWLPDGTRESAAFRLVRQVEHDPSHPSLTMFPLVERCADPSRAQ